VRLDESTARGRQATKDGHRRGERRVGHHVEGSSRQAQVRDVGTYDLHRPICESRAKFLGPLRVQFEREHYRAGAYQWISECPGSSSEVEHEIASTNGGLIDESLSPRPMKLVPSPSREFPGHGGPS
jgi:hypothetical protein